MTESSIRSYLTTLARTAERAAETLATDASAAADVVLETLERGGTLFFCGNGGSAADAQHLAAEYVVRFQERRPGLPAIALTVDSSILTASGNDLGFEHVFARQVEALGREGDLLVLHSTSGRSENLLRAAAMARLRGVGTLALLARDGGPLASVVDRALIVPTDVTAHAQEVQLALGHAICAEVDRAWGGGERNATVVAALARMRRAEKAQTLWYRALAARAEAEGDAAGSERFNGLHADEQHHLSRLTARLLELGVPLAELRDVRRPVLPDEALDEAVRRREEAEVLAYEALSQLALDDDTRAVVDEILESERHHARALGGKWMPA